MYAHLCGDYKSWKLNLKVNVDYRQILCTTILYYFAIPSLYKFHGVTYPKCCAFFSVIHL